MEGRGRDNAGFTLLEFTMAMTITTIIGLCVAGVSLALSQAREHTQEYFVNVQEGRTAMNRMSNALRSAKLVLSASDDCVTLWARDVNGDGEINVSELRTWVHDKSDATLKQGRVVLPRGLDDSIDLNNVIGLRTPPTTLKNSPYIRWEALAEDVHAFKVTAKPGAPLTALLGVDVTIGEGDRSVRLCTAVRPRATYVSLLSQNDDGYVLTPPTSARLD